MKRIYLDYAAATPIADEVVKEMEPYLKEEYGNAGALHSFGARARAGIDKAREIIAHEIMADQREIIFTGSATEANNLIIRGVVEASEIEKPHIIISAIEHESVLDTCKSLGDRIDLTIVPVSSEGIVSPNDIKNALKRETVLVSIVYASSVLGTIQPIREIGKIVNDFKEKESSPIFHSDAAQAFQFEKIDVEESSLDALTLSSQKIYGPKGVGALYIKEDKKRLIKPIIVGGMQEYGLRAGTQNTASIVGFGKAVELIGKERNELSQKVGTLRDFLWESIQKEIPDAEINGSMTKRLPNNLNIYFPQTDSETLLIGLDQAGIAISVGSACKGLSHTPPFAVTALNLGKNRANHSVRITLGKQTTKAETDNTVEALIDLQS